MRSTIKVFFVFLDSVISKSIYRFSAIANLDIASSIVHK